MNLILPPKPVEEEEHMVAKPPGGRDCLTCEFFVRPDPGHPGGVCHGEAPVSHMLGVQQDKLGRPVPMMYNSYVAVGAGDWCRHWALHPDEAAKRTQETMQ